MNHKYSKKERRISSIIGEDYDPGSFKAQLVEIFSRKYFFFLFRPVVIHKDFTEKEVLFRRFKSKRSLFQRLITPLTIFGLILIFIITTCAVFDDWILFSTRIFDLAY